VLNNVVQPNNQEPIDNMQLPQPSKHAQRSIFHLPNLNRNNPQTPVYAHSQYLPIHPSQPQRLKNTYPTYSDFLKTVNFHLISLYKSLRTSRIDTFTIFDMSEQA